MVLFLQIIHDQGNAPGMVEPLPHRNDSPILNPQSNRDTKQPPKLSLAGKQLNGIDCRPRQDRPRSHSAMKR